MKNLRARAASCGEILTSPEPEDCQKRPKQQRMALLRLLALWAAVCLAAGRADGGGCTFHAGRDYADPAGPVLNATSAAQCCALCLATPTCAVAVFAKPSSTAGASEGRCYTKISAKAPVEKGATAQIVGCVTGRAAVTDKYYDCRFRKLALDFTSSVVLASWSPRRAAEARAAVENGLRIEQCDDSDNDESVPRQEPVPPRRGEEEPQRAATEELFVATDGDDTAAGTAEAPLRSIAGAQARIRARHPSVAARPAIRVTLRQGDYYLNSSGIAFGAADSGSAAETPIVYAAEPSAGGNGEAATVTLHGGSLLSAFGLHWAPSSKVKGAFAATLPAGIVVDNQDQLYLGGQPLVRARIPNGRPWCEAGICCPLFMMIYIDEMIILPR